MSQSRVGLPRPMKATKPFGSAVKPTNLWPQGSPLPGTMRSSVSDRRGSPVNCGLNSPKDAKTSPKTPGRGTPSPITNPRRANSLNSLNDHENYMNSMWPKVQYMDKSIQTDDTGLEDIEEEGVKSVVKVHKRSSSYGNAYGLERTEQSSLTPKSIPLSVSGHSRLSSESLEITEFLGGKEDLKMQLPYSNLDGRMAPVDELVTQLSNGMQILGPGDLSPTPPHSTPSSPMVCSVATQTPRVIRSPTSQSPSGSREHSPDNMAFAQKCPSSPKTTFAREPPDGADKCIGKPSEPLLQLHERKIQAPDVSKANIQFTGGSAFTKLSS